MTTHYNPNAYPDASLEEHLMNIVSLAGSAGGVVVTKLKHVEIRLGPRDNLAKLDGYYRELLEYEE